MDGSKVTAGVRKAKKKQVKDELDRIKQAEKKKRRLEKALATSAAIRSELEKKKQKKKEEQERLDEEGAAIAEAVALNVLLGEDSDESSKNWEYSRNMEIVLGRRQALVPYQDVSKYSLGNFGWVSTDPYRYECMWNNHWGNSNFMVSSDPLYSAGQLAAQAVSSLKIADDSQVDAYLFNHMLRG
ncbi:hypothetical protein ABFS83_06G029600 [Erythranthe nasuta]